MLYQAEEDQSNDFNYHYTIVYITNLNPPLEWNEINCAVGVLLWPSENHSLTVWECLIYYLHPETYQQNSTM